MARGLLDALPAITLLIAVTQFGGFLFSCGSSRRNGGHAYRATIEPNLGFNGGVATRIENLTAYNAYDLCHRLLPVLKMKKLLPDGRSYQNRLPGTVKVRPITYAITKLDYSSWHLRGQCS
jgi:hypothetical protein